MKEPFALLVNDLHVNKDNIYEFRKNWNEVLEICSEEGIGNVIIGGDLFTSRSSQTLSVLLTVYSAFKEAYRKDIEICIAPGNHDKGDLNSKESYCDLFASMKNVVVVPDWITIHEDNSDWALILLAYFPENETFWEVFDQAYEDFKQQFPHFDESNCILYLHEGIHGALGNFEIPGELDQKPFLNFKKVLAGHYHGRKKIPGTPIEYIGSSRQHDFGEDEEKGYTILYTDGSTKFIKNKVNVRFKTIELEYADLKDYQLVKEPNYKYKLKVNCSDKEAETLTKQELRDLGFDKVELLHEAEISKNPDALGIYEKYDRHGILSEYRKYCEEQNIDEKLGIEYL